MGFRSFIGQQQPLGLIVLLLVPFIFSIQQPMGLPGSLRFSIQQPQPMGRQLIQQPLGRQLAAISRPLGQQLTAISRPLGPTVKQRMGQRGRT